MPALVIEDLGVPAASSFGQLLKDLLDEAARIRSARDDRTTSSAIEPPLNQSDLKDLADRVALSLSGVRASSKSDDDESVKAQVKGRKFAIVEAVARHTFAQLTVR